MEIVLVIEALRKSRSLIKYLKIPRRSGVYALYLTNNSSIKGFNIVNDKPMYIGSSETLAERELEHHLNSDMTGFSTVRRTLGAIMKNDLDLKAYQRGSGVSKSNFTNYRFFQEGEKLLTKWIMDNVEIGFCPIFEDYKDIEKKLIAMLQPTLNLTGWKNPDRKRIMELREICADEARNRAV